MFFSHKKLFIVDAICFCIILLALAIRVSRSLPKLAPIPEGSLVPASDITSAPPKVELPVVESEPVVSASRPPLITAQSYLVGNVATGAVYLEHNSKTVLPVASMSKLVTAVVTTDTLSVSTPILITPEETDVPPDGSALTAGERFTAGELLYPLLLNSSNVAAEALASSSDRIRFVSKMNSYSWEIGMPKTYFADPTGLSVHNQATAEDFFALARYLYKFRPDILAMTRTVSTTTATTTEHGSHVFASIHPFVTDPRFIGGKTGHTPEAGDTMLTLLWISGHPLAFIVIGSDSGMRAEDTQMLVDKVSKII